MKTTTQVSETDQQRLFLAAVVDSSKDSVVTIDFNGIITSWNKAAEDLYGYSAKEAIGKNLSLVVLPEDIKQLLVNIDRIKKSKSVEIYDTIRLRKGGDLIDLEVMLSPVKDDRDEVVGVSTIARDITGWAKADAALRRSEEKFRALVSQTSVGIYQTDLNRSVIFTNETLSGILMYSSAELVGHPIWSYTFQEDLEKERELFAQFKNTGKPFNGEKRIVRKDGEIRWVRECISPIYNLEGGLESTMGVVVDVTDQVLVREKIDEIVRERTHELAKANEALQDKNEELKRFNANMEQFGYAVSHDLKEPLRKLLIFTDRLKNSLTQRFTQEENLNLQRIEGATIRMKTLIEDLSSYVSLQPRFLDDVNLDEVIDIVLHDLEIEIEEKNAKVDFDSLGNLKGYFRQLQQLFHNLIGNSLKYGREDLSPEIQISCSEVSLCTKKYRVISVKDNGIGFEQDQAQNIFNVFTRLHADTQYKGTGIGLSIVKKVMENHNGFVEAESKLGKGSVFRLFFPLP